MRNLIFSILTFLFVSSFTSAQEKPKKPFAFSVIIVEASDRDDSVFVAAAVRRALIKSGKAVKSVERGDTLLVHLKVQYFSNDLFSGTTKWGGDRALDSIMEGNGGSDFTRLLRLL